MKLNDIYKKIDSLNKANDLNEQASMNIMMTGDTADDVGVLLKMMQNAGLKDAGPAGEISDPNPRMDIEKFRNIVDLPKPDDHDHGPMDMPPSMPPMDMGPPPGDSPCGEPDDGPSDKGMDIIKLAGIGDKDDGDDKKDDDGDEGTDYANAPDEKYGDTKLMTKDLSGGLNGPKKSYPKVAGGDNPMSIRAELTRLEGSIKDELWKALEEKKAKPDFLDMDKDGDKKEPMKKAIKDKGKK